MDTLTRRAFVGLTLVAPLASRQTASRASTAPVGPAFPAQEPDLVREVVAVSHNNFARVRELVTRQPTLAEATWDHGFGDWESALGAASHVGQRDIALFLIDQGAAPTLFSAAMLGQLDVVTALIAATPGAQRKPGPHGLTLLAHARNGGPNSRAVVEYLTALGDADQRPTTVTVSEEARARISGTYRYGGGERDVLVIDDVRGQLGITRPGRGRQFLWCVESDATGWTCFPSGATPVRIKIHLEGARVDRLTVADPDVLCVARRE